ncbi:hypothetical protein [Klebsiella pneumoniae]|uniref:hypothetical protein n=1 Tax=Klebsiella pneumoniae TaxID=573 RepID=UPI002961F74B|nr:hypothetical protein [Klebsiella pneumoniae]MDW1257580.1 hypothetical protein [Klebsiella pneumoniae]
MKYKSLNYFLDDKKRKEQHRKRLADKLFHTVRSGSSNEIQAVIKTCSDADVDFKTIKHDYLLEYFDSFYNRTSNIPSILIVRLLISYQNKISHKAVLSFYQNIFYKHLLSDEELTELSSLITSYK